MNYVDLCKRSNITFDRTAALLPPYFGQAPVPDDHSFAGVYVNDMKLFNMAGYLSSPSIHFHHLSNGIISVNSITSVSHCDFDLIRHETFYNTYVPFLATGGGNGSGVAAYGTGLINVVGAGIGFADPASFTSCDIGVFVRKPEFFVTGNKMLTVGTGVSATGVLLPSNINRNRIDATNTGIALKFNTGCMNISVFDNTINMDHPFININTPAYCGIFVTENGIYNIINILHNEIHVTNCRNGIYTLGTIFTKMQENTVTLHAAPWTSAYGIRSEGSTGNHNIFNCNAVQGYGTGNGTPTQAYHIQQQTGNYYNCNYSNNTYRGWRFGGMCASTDNFKGNEITDHDAGLEVVGGSGAMGVQGNNNDCKGNMWTGNYGSVGALLSGSPLPNGNNSKIYFHPSCLPPCSTSVSGGFLLFSTNSSASIFDCSLFECQYPPLPHQFMMERLDTLIARDSTIDENYPEASQYEGKRYLYDKLKADTILIGTDSLMIHFMNDVSNTNIAQFCKVTEDENKLAAISSSDKDSIIFFNDAIASLLEQHRLNDSLLSDSTISTADSLILKSQNDSLENLMSYIHTQSKPLMESIHSNRFAKADEIKYQNALINTNEVFEYNERVTNEIYLCTVAKEIFTFTSAQITILYDIAVQCPLAGGRGVYLARALYALVNDTIDYDDEAVCYQNGYSLRHSNTNAKVISNTFKVYPNPTDNELVVEYDSDGKTNQVFVIYNNLGKAISQHDLTYAKSRAIIRTEKFKSSIYFYVLFSNGLEKQSGVISIIHN